jgi:hypothetical protein
MERKTGKEGLNYVGVMRDLSKVTSVSVTGREVGEAEIREKVETAGIAEIAGISERVETIGRGGVSKDGTVGVL